MSYGYQGPPAPFQGQRPPTSFGAPPGTPSAPGAPPYPQSNLGFNRPPTSFGMPQPFASSPYPQPSPYGTQQPSPYGQHQPSAYPSQPSPYPSQPSPYPSQPSPYPSQPSPYPSQPSPYPSQPSPYPPKNQSSPYPTGQNSPYPPGQNSPFPGQNSPYPPGKNAPYPSGQNSSFPGQNPSFPGQNPHFPGQNSSAQPLPYPTQQSSFASAQKPPYPSQASSYASPNPQQVSSFASHRPTDYQQQNPYAAPTRNAYSEASGRPHSSPYPSAGVNSSPYPAHTANASNSGGVYPGGPGTGGGSMYPSCAGLTSSAKPYKNSPAPRRAQYAAKLSPTVVPYDDFDARADAEALRKAMKGFGTDNKAVIEILANRSNLQRQEIAAQFKTLYGKDLIKDLKSELSGNFEDLVVAMMTPIPQYYAKELNNAMSGIGTDECVLIEVLCTMSNHEIRVIKQAYECMYGRTLEDDLRGDTSGNFKRLMVSLCCANRDESFDVDPSAAMEDARQLLQAGELRFGTDESTFNAILVQRNVAQLHQIFTEYQGITGHGIDEAIENEFSGDIKKGLLAIVKCVINRALFFAEQLYKSMKGMGTDDRRLIRLVVTRSEVDMGEIKEAFVQEYGQTLEDFISDDCSGNYKKCLLALVS